MPVVSNSSPLILYAAVGRVDLLRNLFGELLIPPAVRSELVSAGMGRPGEREVATASWIQVRPPARSPAAHELPDDLDTGEAEAIALALESPPPALLLIDDRVGRREALRRELSVVGTAGILVLAKRRGHVASVRPLLDQLRDAGLYLSEVLYAGVLVEAREPAR